MLDKFRDIINNYKNPYPKDIYLWSNTDKVNFTRGRFNKFIYQMVETMRESIMYELIILKMEEDRKNKID